MVLRGPWYVGSGGAGRPRCLEEPPAPPEAAGVPPARGARWEAHARSLGRRQSRSQPGWCLLPCWLRGRPRSPPVPAPAWPLAPPTSDSPLPPPHSLVICSRLVAGASVVRTTWHTKAPCSLLPQGRGLRRAGRAGSTRRGQASRGGRGGRVTSDGHERMSLRRLGRGVARRCQRGEADVPTVSRAPGLDWACGGAQGPQGLRAGGQRGGQRPAVWLWRCCGWRGLFQEQCGAWSRRAECASSDGAPGSEEVPAGRPRWAGWRWTWGAPLGSSSAF